MWRPSKRFCCGIFLAGGLLAAVAAAAALAGESFLAPPGGGSGGYVTTIPAPGQRPDGGKVVMTVPACGPNLSSGAANGRKVPTSDWWTPLAWVDPADLPDTKNVLPAMQALTWQVFSEPLVFQPQKGGLALSLNIPDSQRAAMENGSLTAGAGFMLEVRGDSEHGGKGISPYFNAFFDQDLYLGSTEAGWNQAAFRQAKVTGWSDWFVNFEMEALSGDALTLEKMKVTAGNGNPFALVKLESGRPQVTFRTWNVGTVIPLTGSSFSLNAGQAKDQAIASPAFAVVNQVPYGAPQAPSGQGAYSTYTVYAVFGPAGSTWTLNDSQYHLEQRNIAEKWAPSRAYGTGHALTPTASNGFFYTANAAGTSGSSEPAWPVTQGASVKDGTITWTANTLELRNVINTAACSTGSHYAVAVLPYPWGKGIYDKPDEARVKALLAEFARYAFAEVTDSRVNPDYHHSAAGTDVTVTFSCETTPVGGESPATDGTLFALYPHQFLDQAQVRVLDGTMTEIPASNWANGWYWPSLKGPMMLASGNSFVNELEVPPCLPALPDNPDRAKADRMEAYLRQALASVDPNFMSQGSYFGAQEMHRLAMLLPIAAMIEEAATDPAAVQTDAKNLYGTVADAISYRLQATKSGDVAKTAADHVFYYDSRWGSMIPTPEDGFAADSLLNDHHFHYGYFIKIATELARWEKAHPADPANKGWATAYAPMIRLLIKDIANTSRTGSGSEPDFPFLRHFSPYAGHSWASGSSRGNQGGQQESTPEAIQAWAAILLWAQLNYPENGENADLERWAAYMFASEARAARLYWFGFTDQAAFAPYLSFRQFSAKSTQVPKPYTASMVSQVNQNEMTFQTDFGNPPLLKHGIQWLPLTGSSLYLGTVSGDADANVRGYLENDLPNLGDGGTSPSNKDKLLMVEAMTTSYKTDPRTLIATGAGGVSPLDSWRMQWEVPTPTFDNLILQDTSRGAMFWWIDTLLSHGVPRGGAGADHASAASFVDEDGDIVYTAYNPNDSPLRVTFADGKILDVPPLAHAHEEASETGESSGGGCNAVNFPAVLVLLLPLFFLGRQRR